MIELLRSAATSIDDWVWQRIFGEADYMLLHPPIELRLRILARFPLQYAAPESCDRPIFIVGCPRSGTTLLYELLQHGSGLRALGQESHWVWEYMHPPRQAPDHSQALEADDLTSQSRRFIEACYGAAFGTDRFVDKCPTNTLRIGAIRSVFPQAVIVGLTRNGPDNVSSLIDTWTDPDRFHGFDVPCALDIDGYSGEKWVHVLPPGWKQFTNAPIERVCAHQWKTLNRTLLEARAHLPSDDFVRVQYESFLECPVETVRSLYDRLQLTWTEDVESHVQSLDQNVVNTKTSPRLGKWKDRNPGRVARILPEIEPVMRELGYQMPSRV